MLLRADEKDRHITLQLQASLVASIYNNIFGVRGSARTLSFDNGPGRNRTSPIPKVLRLHFLSVILQSLFFLFFKGTPTVLRKSHVSLFSQAMRK